MERFEYSSHTSAESAESAIDDYYAAGEIDDTDLPKVERRKRRDGRIVFVVTLAGIGR